MAQFQKITIISLRMNTKKTVKPHLIKNMLSDIFSDTWKLLSETSRFLSRTEVFSLYEEELRLWRYDLQRSEKNSEEHKRIRQEIIELRTSLRHQGFDLSLARQNLVVEGFRNDASFGEGFRRVVIFFGDDDLIWLSGEDNHITLAELLEKQLSARIQKQSFPIRSKHFLWYCRKGNTLILSGSDSETKEAFERLKAMAEARSLEILAKLKNLH